MKQIFLIYISLTSLFSCFINKINYTEERPKTSSYNISNAKVQKHLRAIKPSDVSLPKDYIKKHPNDWRTLNSMMALWETSNNTSDNTFYNSEELIYRSYLYKNKIKLKDDLLQRYAQEKELINNRLSLHGEDETNTGMRNEDYINNKWYDFLIRRYNRNIDRLLNDKNINLNLSKEYSYRDAILQNECKLLNIGGRLCWGSSIWMRAGNTTYSCHERWKNYQEKCINELLNKKEHEKSNIIIKDNAINSQMQHLLKSLYVNYDYINEKANYKKQATNFIHIINKNIQAWFAYRVAVSKTLTGTTKTFYDDQTNRFKQELISEFKEMEGYGQ